MLLRPFLDLLFPKLCAHCKEPTEGDYFCPLCWQESSPLALDSRCHHCFELLETSDNLCSTCRHHPLLPFVRAAVFDRNAPIRTLKNSRDTTQAMAAFAYYQWLRLSWESVNLIAPIPPQRSSIACAFAELAHLPCPNLLRRRAWPLNTDFWEVRDILEEGESILLFDDDCTSAELQLACKAISHAFPKRVYLLSLFY
ncbi:MAG: hypothetical protein KGJ02_07850 [Verrucomicrobiota bacterium]|nr:hypothetical protein [Verrucomicrobiota bacterium]